MWRILCGFPHGESNEDLKHIPLVLRDSQRIPSVLSNNYVADERGLFRGLKYMNTIFPSATTCYVYILFLFVTGVEQPQSLCYAAHPFRFRLSLEQPQSPGCHILDRNTVSEKQAAISAFLGGICGPSRCDRDGAKHTHVHTHRRRTATKSPAKAQPRKHTRITYLISPSQQGKEHCSPHRHDGRERALGA